MCQGLTIKLIQTLVFSDRTTATPDIARVLYLELTDCAITPEVGRVYTVPGIEDTYAPYVVKHDLGENLATMHLVGIEYSDESLFWDRIDDLVNHGWSLQT